ncbi:MAG TPA: helix-turn-helix domain-containing protein [Pseudorhizobium sp.]|nr:helix-turn-helix domain-containing protein [Pseudorhizobium sp.]
MSHHATNWAIQQRGIKPALKVVLWHLADCHNPAYGGTFPSQEYLAERCEIPRSTLNGYLDQLEEAGLIARERRRKAGSRRQDRTRYYFPFEPLFSQFSSAVPSPETGLGSGDAESGNGQKPSPEIAESRVQNLDRNPVRETVSESVREKDPRETPPDDADQDDDEEENSKSLERRVKALEIGRHNNPWPGSLGKETRWAVLQFGKLTPLERLQAEERRDDYLAACGGKPVSLGVYLRDKKFLDVAAMKAATASPSAGTRIAAPMFGPAWCSARTMALLAGPVRLDMADDARAKTLATFEILTKSGMHGARRYAAAKGLIVSADGRLVFPEDFEEQEWRRKQIAEGFPEVNRLQDTSKGPVLVDARYAALKPFCEAVPVGSEVWEEWRQWHGEGVYPWLPDTGAMRVVWFPAGGPGGIQAFEQHAKEVFDDRG